MREDNIKAHTEHIFTFFKVQGWFTNTVVILSTHWRVELITEHARNGAILSGILSVIIAVFLSLLDRNSYRELLRPFKVEGWGGGMLSLCRPFLRLPVTRVDCRCFLRGLWPVFWALSHVVPTPLEGLVIVSLLCGSVNTPPPIEHEKNTTKPTNQKRLVPI